MRTSRYIAVLLLSLWFAVALFAQTNGKATSDNADLESLKQYLRESVLDKEEQDVSCAFALQDLNGDGNPEAIVYWSSSSRCGSGGCNTYILQRADGSWRIVTEIAVSRPPIRMLNQASNGWHDLTVLVAGGGILPGYEALLQFDGTSYPENPTVPPARELKKGLSGKVLIRSVEDAVPLLETKAQH